MSAAFVCLFVGCDPGLSGDSRIFNDTNKTLTIRFPKSENHVVDTITMNLKPGQSLILFQYSGLGNKRAQDCCAFPEILSLKYDSGAVKKDVNQCDAWVIVNKTKLKKFGGEPIKCELHILQSDL